MDVIVGFLFGVGTVFVVMSFLYFFTPRIKFKVGDIVVRGESENWHTKRDQYKILEIGDNSYKVKTVVCIRDSHKLDSINFRDECQYKVKK